MDKMKMHSVNKVDENVEKIARLFPNCVTESLIDDKLTRVVDFDMLRQELSSFVVEGRDERYQFIWPDKKNSVLLANAPINKTLRPCREESVNFDTTENLYIEGDNLEVLKLLQETYLGKIKMIYIDPPYNTGNDFVYEDDFAQDAGDYIANSGQYDAEGNRLVQNTESNGRFHTDWLNMIYPRLKLAKDLMTDDGVIFISIDDHEADNLKKACDIVFGESCFVANLSWQRTYSIRNDSKGIPIEVEHILVYSRAIEWEPKKLPRTEKMDAAYSNPDGDTCSWMSGSPVASEASTHQGMVYAIQHPFTGDLIYPSDTAHWRYSQSQMLEYMNGWCKYKLQDLHDDEQRAQVCGISPSEIRPNVKAIVLDEPLTVAKEKAQLVYNKGPWPRFYFTNGGLGGIRRKVYSDSVGGRIATNYWCYDEVGHTDEAKKEIKTLFDGNAPFDTPKPTRLLDRMLTIATDKDSLVLDFFSGSATTAHAVMKKNAEDGGHRKYILVQLPESSSSPIYANLCEIGKERIRRAGIKIRNDISLNVNDTAMMHDGATIGGKKIVRSSTLRSNGVMTEKERTLFDPESETETNEKYDRNDSKNRYRFNPAALDIGFRVLKCDSSNMKDVYYSPSKYEPSLFSSLTDNIKEDRTPEDLLFQVMLDLGVLLSSIIDKTTIAGKKVFSVADGYLIACFDEHITDETIKEIAQKKPYYFVMRDGGYASDSVATNFDQIFAAYSPTTIRKVL